MVVIDLCIFFLTCRCKMFANLHFGSFSPLAESLVLPNVRSWEDFVLFAWCML